ncbi:MAG TPA: squalene synthase HpnD [Gammaproteobacteria bacterium]|nr:squalene synthase HpnD [Gammaproteobacteria bacterium]
MSPDQYCQDKAARSGSSFYYSFLFLPAAQRRAITALYAFCREVDDVVDECSDTDVARRKLDWWREELERCFAGEPRHPVTQALQQPLADHNLPIEYFQEIIDGMTMDLDQTRYESFNELALYCHRVAGVVGLLSAEIFGYRHRDTLKYAQQLGTAFQLTNIIRDVREDAERGRIYLPLDELLEYRINPHNLLQGNLTDELHDLLAFQAQRARQYYQRALSQLPVQDRYAQRSGVIMAAIYQTLLDEMEADGFRVMQQRVRLTPIRKLWIAWKTARRERRHRQRGKSSAHA